MKGLLYKSSSTHCWSMQVVWPCN